METDIIVFVMKLFAMNTLMYYCFNKILINKEHKLKNTIIFSIINMFISILIGYIEFSVNPFLYIIILILVFSYVLSKFCNESLVYSAITVTISYAICLICFGISTVTTFSIYKILSITNKYVCLAIILAIQSVLILIIFKIKRFSNSFAYLHKRLDNEFADIVMINVSTSIILVTCFIGALTENIDIMSLYLFIAFVMLAFTMIILIQKTLTMYYKQKLLKDTIANCEKSNKEKDEKIERLSNEKYKISEALHKFYNRQEALKMAVCDEKVKKNIQNLTEEFSKEISVIKGLDKIPTTGIYEIDNMFKYMQNECYLNKIQFNLNIEGNMHYLINNIIPKSKLETLIGDHLKDAINAVNKVDTNNKEIFAILGIKNGYYELCIFDTGVDFDIDTMLKLGKQKVTTCDNGNGIGFMTTFETMKETNASLIITENAPNENRHYTKSVTIRFDGQFKYIIDTYRAEEIKLLCKRDDIIINRT